MKTLPVLLESLFPWIYNRSVSYAPERHNCSRPAAIISSLRTTKRSGRRCSGRTYLLPHSILSSVIYSWRKKTEEGNGILT